MSIPASIFPIGTGNAHLPTEYFADRFRLVQRKDEHRRAQEFSCPSKGISAMTYLFVFIVAIALAWGFAQLFDGGGPPSGNRNDPPAV